MRSPGKSPGPKLFRLNNFLTEVIKFVAVKISPLHLKRNTGTSARLCARPGWLRSWKWGRPNTFDSSMSVGPESYPEPSLMTVDEIIRRE